MRTKSFLAAAALIAAGALTSQAQSNVYSLNVVGYVNLTVKPGYNLLAAQLKNSTGSTAINATLTNVTGLAEGSTFFKWNAGAQDFTEAAVFIATPPDGPAWYFSDFSGPTTDVAARGESFFVFNAGGTDATITLVGEVPQGSDSVSVPNNYGFLADTVPAVQEVITNGFPVADGSTLTTFNPLTQDYTEALVGIATPPDGPAWYLSDFSAQVQFAPAVGQGFLYNTPAGAATWTRNFTVK